MPKQIDVLEFSQTILQKSLPLFAEKGYQGLSMRQLASALNMSTGTLYHYFQNKDELYIKMLHLLAKDDAIALASDTSASATPEQKISSLIHFLNTRSAYFFNILQLVFEHQRFVASTTKPLTQEFIDVFEKPIRVYENTLKDIFDLDHKKSQTLLNFLMGCFVRSLLSHQAPDFSMLANIISALNKPKNTKGSAP